MIEYEAGQYIGTEIQHDENALIPIIYQEVQEVIQYSDKIEIYVKTAFVDVKNDKYVMYKSFDNKFYGELLQLEPELLLGNTSNIREGVIATRINQELNNIREELNTYKYTFTLNYNEKDYFLSEFSEVRNK